MEKKLKNDLSWWASFPELNPNMVMEVNNQGEILYANKTVKKIFATLKTEDEKQVLFSDFKSIYEILTAGDQKELTKEVKIGDTWLGLTYVLIPNGNLRLYGKDITERKNKEARIFKLNKILKAISDSNHATICSTGETTEQEYFEKTCKIIIDDCGYSFVWIGLAENDEKKSVRPVAYAGFDKSYIEKLNVTWSDTERGRGPTGTAIRTGRLTMCKNMQTDPNFLPWRQEALKRGYASSLVLPLKVGDSEPLGAISIYSAVPDGFLEEEVNLLSELADDLAYEISALGSHKKLQISENKFKSMFDFSPIGMFLLDIEGNILDCNQKAVEMYGASERQKFLGRNCFDFIDEPFLETVREKWVQVLKTGFITNFELIFTKTDGQKINTLVSATLLLNVAQKPYSIIAMIQDITQIKIAEESAIAAKNEWEKTFDNMPDLVAVLDSNHRIIRVNKAMTQRLGTSLSEIMGLNCFKCMHKLSAPPAFCPHTLTVKDGKEHTAEIYEDTLKGTFLITTTPLFDKNEEITGSIHVARDITERVKTEHKIKEQALMLEEATDAAIGYDNDHRVTFWNKAAEEMYGYTFDEVKGEVAHDLLKTVYTERNGLTRQKFLSKIQNSGRAKAETIRFTKDGRKMYVESRSVAIRDKNRNITSVISIHRDITERKEHEEKLKKVAHKLKVEAAKYEALLSSIGHGVAAVDKTGKIIFANKDFYSLLPKNYNLVGKRFLNVLDLYSENGHFLKPSQRPLFLSLAGKTIISRNYYCIGKNNKKINLGIATAPILLHNKIIGAVGVYEDITREKESEKAKTEFVSLASHQLRTPITEISLSTEMLLSGMAGKVSKEHKKYLKNITAGVKEITSLIETLLNLSRMQMGTFMIDPRPTNLPALIDKLVSGFALQIKKKKLSLEKQYEEDLPKINLDPRIMQMVLENLFSNAIKYTEAGSIKITVKKGLKSINIEVSDTGCGIPERQKHLVFSKLFRSDNALKNKTKGHGLGLYIVRALLKNAGGKISFESKEGKGTKFLVSFPLRGMKKRTQQSLI